MKIEIGKQYVNQTWNYLFPCLLDHGDVFKNKINSVFKLAVGIHDTLLDGSDHIQGANIYILLDAKHKPGYYKAFIDWVRIQPFYQDDYWFDVDLSTARKHMVIISVPNKHELAYKHFLKSQYSKMYDKTDLKRFFYDRNKEDLYNIMMRNVSGKQLFAEKVNKEFASDIHYKEVEGECEFPLIKEENIFNAVKGERTYFNEHLDKVWA